MLWLWPLLPQFHPPYFGKYNIWCILFKCIYFLTLWSFLSFTLCNGDTQFRRMIIIWALPRFTTRDSHESIALSNISCSRATIKWSHHGTNVDFILKYISVTFYKFTQVLLLADFLIQSWSNSFLLLNWYVFLIPVSLLAISF